MHPPARHFLSCILLTVSLGALLFGCASIDRRAPGEPNDFHVGLWLSQDLLKEGEEAITATLDDAAARGVTAIYPSFWARGYVVYPESRFARQHPDFTGWNPLEVVLRESHKRGLAVHLWAEAGVFTHRNFSDSQEDAGYILEQNPDWVAESREGRISWHNPARNSFHYALNPAHPEARRFLRDLMLEAVRLHPGAAGLNLDRIRYPAFDFSYDPYSLKRFKAEHGFDPLQIGPEPERQSLWNRWRIDQLNTFMREMTESFQSEFPRKVLSAAVVPPYLMDDKFQRWDQMVAQGHLRLPIPRIRGTPELARREIERSAALLPPGTRFYVGLELTAFDLADLPAAIELARAHNAAGVVLLPATSRNR